MAIGERGDTQIRVVHEVTLVRTLFTLFYRLFQGMDTHIVT